MQFVFIEQLLFALSVSSIEVSYLKDNYSTSSLFISKIDRLSNVLLNRFLGLDRALKTLIPIFSNVEYDKVLEEMGVRWHHKLIVISS